MQLKDVHDAMSLECIPEKVDAIVFLNKIAMKRNRVCVDLRVTFYYNSGLEQ